MNIEQKLTIIKMRKEAKTISEIARTVGVTRKTVYSFYESIGIDIHSDINFTICKNCEKIIFLEKKRGKPRAFCCNKCHDKYWNSKDRRPRITGYNFNCPVCNKKVNSYGNHKKKYCSYECYIKDRFNSGENENV